MTPDQLAAIHQKAFTTIRPWSRDEIAGLLESPLCFLVTEGESFAIGRVVGPEAELLTLAVAPLTQGKGLGRTCLGHFEREAAKRGATEFFLEVASDNIAAISLYKTNGYQEISRRKDYYSGLDGQPRDALILQKTVKI